VFARNQFRSRLKIARAMSEVGIKSVSRLSDQVEEKIARANRAFRLSSRIVAAARDDLNGHGEWLDRHRATWTEEVKRQRRLLYRKVTMRALTRSIVGIVFAAPYALWRALALTANGILSRDPANESLQGPRSRTIRGLDGPLCTMKPVRSCSAQRDIETPSRRDHTVSQGLNGQEQAATRKRPASILGVIALCLIAAGAVRATLSSPTGEAPALAAKKAQPIPPLKKSGRLLAPRATSVTVSKTPRPAKRPAGISGSVILARPSDYAPVQMPPRTVTDIAVISRPLALASAEPEREPEATSENPVVSPAPAPVAEKPAAAKPVAKPKPKRRVARRQPQPVPWWQQWSWMRLR
jgi:hypothetical protein